MKIVKTIACAILFLTAFGSKAQLVKDTLFYDNYWRICEKPVAGYYRIGQLQLGPKWYFVNGVKDFYSEGSPEMAGQYSSDGKKNGVFTFYHPNGKLKKIGAFVNDTMKGLWSYYDAKGELYFQLTCDSARLSTPFFIEYPNNDAIFQNGTLRSTFKRLDYQFTPLFIRNPAGDTLLKNGTGRFAFKLLDYPDVFPDAKDRLVKGQCVQGKRTGDWYCDAFFDNDWHPWIKESYGAGRFEGGALLQDNSAAIHLRRPALIAELSAVKWQQTETFAHDAVFGTNAAQAYPPQLTAFLLRGDVPVFGAVAKEFEANVLDYLPLCVAALGYGRWDTLRMAWHKGNIASAKGNDDAWLLGYCVQTTNPEIMRQSDLFPVQKLKAYNAQIDFTVYEDGTTSDVSVKGNFERDIMLHLGYYLSRLIGLAPKREDGKAVAAQQNLYIFTRANTATYRKHSYIVYRLLASLKPQEQTIDKFNVVDFAKERFEDDEQ